MNERQRNIVEILHDNGSWVTGSDLSRMLNVSDRTIRSDISKINEMSDNTLILSNKRYGYEINSDVLLLNKVDESQIESYTPENRCVWIAKQMLLTKSISLIELESKMYVSESSIDNDLKKIRDKLESFETLKLVKSDHSISLAGDEYEKRILYKILLDQEIKGNFMNLTALGKLWDDFDILEVSRIFDRVCHMFDYHLREDTYVMTLLHAGIAIERIRDSAFISNVKPISSDMDLEYNVSKHFFKNVSANLKIPYVEDEVIWFSYLLRGKSYDCIKSNENINVQEIVNEIINHINNIYDIDFTGDNELVSGLTSHVLSLISRVNTCTKVSNLYLKEVKKKYPLVFDMAVNATEIIAERINKSVDENEIALIALHLGAAYERKITNDKYRVITIIPHNVVLANACLEKIKKHFDDRIDIVDNFKLVDEVKINLLSPDLIISTIPINTKLKAPIVEIKLFFDYEDESMIRRTLDTLERQKNQKEFIALLKRVIRKDYCYFGYDFQTKEECIAYLCNELVKKGIAPEGYEQDVLKRENISSTSFVQGFAVPHSLTVKTTKQYISLMTLKHPIQWGQFEVGLVILMGINNDDSELIRIFFEWLTHIVTNPEMISKLFSTKSYDELMKNIKEDI